jgi:hypothetical protein
LLQAQATRQYFLLLWRAAPLPYCFTKGTGLVWNKGARFDNSHAHAHCQPSRLGPSSRPAACAVCLHGMKLCTALRQWQQQLLMQKAS